MKLTLLICLYSTSILFASAQGIFWEQTTGLPAVDVIYFTSLSTGELFAMADSVLFISRDDGVSWQATARPISGRVSSRMGTDSLGNLFVPASGRVFMSTDLGESWTTSNQVPGTAHAGFAVSPGGILFYGYGQGIARSSDRGISWSTHEYYPAMNDVVVRPTGEVVAGFGYFQHGSTGFYPVGGYVNSLDGGQTWSSRGGGVHRNLWVDGDRSVFMYKIHREGLTIFTEIFRYGCCLGSGAGIYNAGGYLSLVSSHGILYATNSRGVLISIDAGQTWDTLNTGLPDLTAGTLHVTPGNHLLVSLSPGVYRSTSLPTPVEENTRDGHPVDHSLFRNYPNPFNASTTFFFSLARPTFVSLRIFDILGREVGELVDAQLLPGRHTISWNAENLESGVYFAHLSYPGVHQVQKLLCIK